MAVVEAILAVFGLVVLLMLAFSAIEGLLTTPPERTEADLSAPYREGLMATFRLQQAAEDLEQQMYAKATRQAATDQTPSSPDG